MNYDTVIEQFCIVYKLQLSDGFESQWESSFEKSRDVRLYKLHGSVTWYKTDHQDYVKVPILAQVDEIELVTKEKAKSLILYPMQKWEYDEPLLEIQMLLKKRLETAKLCIVPGYSFRDQHITKIFWDAARKNRDLHLILISPHSYRTYDQKLKLYPDSTHSDIPSSLSGRVVSLPYRFEDVLPELDLTIVRNLTNGLSWEAHARDEELQHGNPDWLNVVKMFVDAEHVDKVGELLQQHNWESLRFNWQDRFQYAFKMLVLFIARFESNAVREWVERLEKTIKEFESNKLKMHTDGQTMSLYFPVSPAVNMGTKQVADALQQMMQFANSRAKMLEESASEKVARLITAFGELQSYMSLWQDGLIPISQYTAKRQDDSQPFLDALANLQQGKGDTDQTKDKASRLAESLERRHLEVIMTRIRNSLSNLTAH